MIKLIANDSMVLTNGETFGAEIYLGCNDRKENWYEVPISEAEKIRNQAGERDEQPNTHN